MTVTLAPFFTFPSIVVSVKILKVCSVPALLVTWIFLPFTYPSTVHVVRIISGGGATCDAPFGSPGGSADMARPAQAPRISIAVKITKIFLNIFLTSCHPAFRSGSLSLPNTLQDTLKKPHKSILEAIVVKNT